MPIPEDAKLSVVEVVEDEDLGYVEDLDVEPEPDFEADLEYDPEDQEDATLDEEEAADGDTETELPAEEVSEVDAESEAEEEDREKPPTAEEIRAVEEEFGALTDYPEELEPDPMEGIGEKQPHISKTRRELRDPPQIPRKPKVLKTAHIPKNTRKPHMQPGHSWDEDGKAVVDKEAVAALKEENQAPTRPDVIRKRTRLTRKGSDRGFENPMSFKVGIGPKK